MGRRREHRRCRRRRPGAPAAGRRRLRTSREKVTTTRREEGSSSLAWRERIKKRKERGGGEREGVSASKAPLPLFCFVFLMMGEQSLPTQFFSLFLFPFFLSLLFSLSKYARGQGAAAAALAAAPAAAERARDAARPAAGSKGSTGDDEGSFFSFSFFFPFFSFAASAPARLRSGPPASASASRVVFVLFVSSLFPAQGSAHSNSRKHQQSGRRRTRKARKKSGRRRGETQGRGRRRSLLLLGSKDARPRFPLRRLGGAGPLRRGLGRVAIGDGGVRACVGPRGGAERRRKRQKRCRGRDARRCRRGLPGRRRGTLRSGRDLFRRPRGPELG